MSLHVQRDIPVPLERLWELTQNPAQHQRWDLRFSEIRYLPRENPDAPQSFIYETRLAFGLTIRGTGTTRGERQAAGTRTSALVFGSDSPLSLIRQGSGYWQYVPTQQGVRFITVYDYAVRWGRFGWLLDRAIFRPLLAWATAWSFDRLALWAAEGVTPERSLRLTASYWIARLALAAVWIHQGLVPKLLGPHPAEVKMLEPLFLRPLATQITWWIGWVEVLFGLLILLRGQTRWPAWLTLLLMPIAFAVAALNGTDALTAPFNVTALNGLTMALAAVVLLLQPLTVTSPRCRWGSHQHTRRGRLSGLWTAA